MKNSFFIGCSFQICKCKNNTFCTQITVNLFKSSIFSKKKFLHRLRYIFLYFCIVNDINKMNTRKDDKMADEQLKLENQLCFRLYTAARLTMGAYHPYLDPMGITYPQYLVMLVLWEEDKQPVCDIAKKLLLDTNTVTPLLQRMEKAGFISRAKGKADTRQRIVSLTPKGKALYEQAKPIPGCLLNDVALKTGEMEDLLKIIPTLDMLINGLKKTKQ